MTIYDYIAINLISHLLMFMRYDETCLVNTPSPDTWELVVVGFTSSYVGGADW